MLSRLLLALAVQGRADDRGLACQSRLSALLHALCWGLTAGLCVLLIGLLTGWYPALFLALAGTVEMFVFYLLSFRRGRRLLRRGMTLRFRQLRVLRKAIVFAAELSAPTVSQLASLLDQPQAVVREALVEAAHHGWVGSTPKDGLTELATAPADALSLPPSETTHTLLAGNASSLPAHKLARLCPVWALIGRPRLFGSTSRWGELSVSPAGPNWWKFSHPGLPGGSVLVDRHVLPSLEVGLRVAPRRFTSRPLSWATVLVFDPAAAHRWLGAPALTAVRLWPAPNSTWAALAAYVEKHTDIPQVDWEADALQPQGSRSPG